MSPHDSDADGDPDASTSAGGVPTTAQSSVTMGSRHFVVPGGVSSDPSPFFVPGGLGIFRRYVFLSRTSGGLGLFREGGLSFLHSFR